MGTGSTSGGKGLQTGITTAVCSSKTYQQVRNLQFHFRKANGKIDHYLILLEDHLLVLVIVDVGVVL